VFPNLFSIALHLVLYGFLNVVLLEPNMNGGPILGLLPCFYVWSEYFYIEESPKFQNFLFVMSQSKKLIAKKEKRKKKKEKKITIGRHFPIIKYVQKKKEKR
jgi:hypothetical protein